MKITDLPFNRFIGIQAKGNSGDPLSLPSDTRYTNHLGTVHAGALMALAEAASGDFLIRSLAGCGFEVLPVVRRFEAKFRKPAHGEIRSQAVVGPELWEKFSRTLQEKGRALLEIPVEIHDESGTHVLSATAEWFVAKSA